MAIEETVSAAEANRSFSRLLRGVREGRSYVVTVHGRPIARLLPAAGGDAEDRWMREAALRALLERVAKQPVIVSGGGRATSCTSDERGARYQCARLCRGCKRGGAATVGHRTGASTGKERHLVPVQALGELCNVLVRKSGWAGDQARAAILTWRDAFPLAPTTEAAIVAAVDLAADHRLGIWDRHCG